MNPKRVHISRNCAVATKPESHANSERQTLSALDWCGARKIARVRGTARWPPRIQRLSGCLLICLFLPLLGQAAVRNSLNFKIDCDEVLAATGTSQASGKTLISALSAERGATASTNFVLRSGCGEYIAERLAIATDRIFSNGFE